MKLLRIGVLVIFGLSTIAFTWFKIYENNKLDMVGPEIKYEKESITVSVTATKEDLISDVKAFDQEDGDVTDSIIIEKISKIALGKRVVTYAAFDSNNNITMKNRDLYYTDYTPPRFSLSKPLIFHVGDFNGILNHISATDCIDGDISDKIRYELPENFFYDSSTGSYKIRFQVTNSIGDTAVLPATIDLVYPNSDSKDKAPEIILKDYLIYIKAGDSFNAKDYIKKIKIGPKNYTLEENLPTVVSGSAISASAISVEADMDLWEPGVYEIKYSITAPLTGYEGSTKLLVVVEE